LTLRQSIGQGQRPKTLASLSGKIPALPHVLNRAVPQAGPDAGRRMVTHVDSLIVDTAAATAVNATNLLSKIEIVMTNTTESVPPPA